MMNILQEINEALSGHGAFGRPPCAGDVDQAGAAPVGIKE